MFLKFYEDSLTTTQNLQEILKLEPKKPNLKRVLKARFFKFRDALFGLWAKFRIVKRR